MPASITTLCANPEAQMALDDLVHDQAALMASFLANEGVQAQVEFLTLQRGMTEDGIRAYLQEATA